MQPNSEKQDQNFSSTNVYPSYQGSPPAYAQYPQQPVGGNGYMAPGKPQNGQVPLYRQEGVVVAPDYRSTWNNVITTPVTPNIRAFFIISGIIYCLWGILSFSIQLGIAVNSYSTYYQGFWTGILIVIGGIHTLIIACRPSYPMTHLIRTYVIGMGLSLLGFVSSILNYAFSTQCTSTYIWYMCDYALTSNLKIVLLVIFLLTTIHSVINIVFVSNIQKKSLSLPPPIVSGY